MELNEQLKNMQTNNRSIVLWCTIRVRTVCESPAFEVGGQTIRKTGRAETDHAEEVLNVFASTE
jgi:hypothetical protein